MVSYSELAESSSTEFRSAASSFLQERGFSVRSVRDAGEFLVVADCLRDKGDVSESYFFVVAGVPVESDLLEVLYREAGESMLGLVSGVVLDEEVRDWASARDVLVLGVDDSADLHSILESVFREAMDRSQAKELFVRKSKTLGLFSTKEVGEVVEGYAPVASFSVERRVDYKTHGVLRKAREFSNKVFVNLNSCELYYVKSGVFKGSEPKR